MYRNTYYLEKYFALDYEIKTACCYLGKSKNLQNVEDTKVKKKYYLTMYIFQNNEFSMTKKAPGISA